MFDKISSNRNQPEEDILMKKTFFLLSFGLSWLLVIFSLNSCKPEEKSIEKQPIQISEEQLQAKDIAVYKIRKIAGKERESLSLDFSGIEKPSSPDEFDTPFHFPPLRQYRTGTCWCFATTSFLESELKRLGKEEIKLSEMYTVYWEYVEKARRFIREKGNSALGEGSEHNAVIERMKQYGIARASDYSGLLGNKTEHDHSELFQEWKNYLLFCQKNEYWDEDKAVSYVKEILNKHLGQPPETIEVDGKTMTPKEFMEKVLELPLDDYVCFISFKYLPFYAKGEYKVPDNWWHSNDYYNLPLDEFYEAMVEALKKGYTLAVGGDISEPGISGENDVALIPTFDIPSPLVDQDSREFRFYNRTSRDDHLIHFIGYKKAGNHDWLLIKDSGGSAHRGQFKGYYFYRSDYVKLKMLTFMVHKDAVIDLLAKFSE